MSALPAQSLPAPRRVGPERAPRRLRPAPEHAGRAKPKLAYAVIALGGVAVIIVAQLLLSIAVTQGAYEIDGLQMKQSALTREEQKLAEDLDRVESPQFLAMNAQGLGMVPNANPVYLRLSDGAVLGQPTAAEGGPGASEPLVPNVLIDGVPPDAGRQAGETPIEGAPGQAGGAAVEAPAAPLDGGLPTPATH
ncbi:hypothetical protein DCE93_06350 [Agromyces badenianii]|uniref:Uncharacterized protein n=1 Tax=Agromyces badenianii TaxID=2080742 RepID=A0A2S0WVU0_9MICO|nr:hypothetical protein [Agromyces badenianii]AWB95324.1 hypothetical protein DCE93_06350 [Agromyces badenianii]PWC04400.1 hypothetical protein DCE94_09695 [Agromyces badenianii]